ncbi:MAG: hypothetical protein R2857_15155 [Vampirovibrionales bacterium]
MSHHPPESNTGQAPPPHYYEISLRVGAMQVAMESHDIGFSSRQLELWYEFFQTGSDKLPSLFESVIQPDPVSVSPTPASSQTTSASLPFEPSDTAPWQPSGWHNRWAQRGSPQTRTMPHRPRSKPLPPHCRPLVPSCCWREANRLRGAGPGPDGGRRPLCRA